MNVSLYFSTITWIFLNLMQSSVGTSCSKYQFAASEQAYYKVHRQTKSWYDARATCALEGAALAYPETAAENALISKLLEDFGLNNSNVWVGAHDIFAEGIFVKLNGEELCYAPWRAGQPDNAGDEDCVIAARGLLVDVPCQHSNPFICKRSSSSAITDSVCQTLDPAYVPNSDNSSCYKIHLQSKTWSQAYAACKAEESDLAVVNSQGEAEFLVQLMENNSGLTSPRHKGCLYIGFHDQFIEGEYLTVQGEPLKQAGYGEFHESQPDNSGNEDCGCIYLNGKFNDLKCEDLTYFICERQIVSDSVAGSFAPHDGHESHTQVFLRK